MTFPTAVHDAPVGGAERVAWRRAGRQGPGVAVALRTSRLGAALAGVTHLPDGDSAAAVGDAARRAELVTLAAVSSGAPVGGAAITVLGPLDDRAAEAVADMVERLAGAVWLVPGLGDAQQLGHEAATLTRHAADPGMDVAAAGVVAAAAAGWGEATGGVALDGVEVTVAGDGDLAQVVGRRASQAGARVTVTRWNPELAPTDVLIVTDSVGRTAEDTREARCRVLVGSIGGPLDDPEVWRAVVARGVVCVPGGLTVGPLMREAASLIAERPAPAGRPRTG